MSKKSVDDQLETIRALLDKADSTTFRPEADAYLAKASQLLAQWGIDEALVWARDGRTGTAEAPVERFIDVPGPYASAKMVLLNQVAEGCGCRCVQIGRGKGALLGFSGDVRRAEALFTSLLMHASSDLAQTGSQANASQTKQFRRSFLLSFAEGVGARLTASRAEEIRRRAEAEAEQAARNGNGNGSSADAADTVDLRSPAASTELVLADRDERVRDALKEHYPHLRYRYYSGASHTGGAAAGSRSADNAKLGGEQVGRRHELHP